MDSIRLGTLLAGARDVGEGINGARRGPVATMQGEVIAIVKMLAPNELIIEMVCALLGRDLGLPIPEPLLVIDDERQAVLAGSIDIGYPSLTQPVLASYLHWLAALLRAWPPLVSAACFDEWIANTDRNDGNLLFDGEGFWLIDHGFAMRQIPTECIRRNRLMDEAIAARTDDLARQRLKREIIVLYETYTDATVNKVAVALTAINALKPLHQEIFECLKFLRQRMAYLTPTTMPRIRTAQGDIDYGL